MFDENDPLAVGMLGMHGTAYANFAVTDCDLLIAVGARFDDRVTGKLDTFAPRAKVIHFEIDPAEVGKTANLMWRSWVMCAAAWKNSCSKASNATWNPTRRPGWLALKAGNRTIP